MVDAEYVYGCLGRIAQEDDSMRVKNQVPQLGREMRRFRDQRTAGRQLLQQEYGFEQSSIPSFSGSGFFFHVANKPDVVPGVGERRVSDPNAVGQA